MSQLCRLYQPSALSVCRPVSDGGYALIGQSIRSLVARMSIVSTHPVPLDLMRALREHHIQRLPQIDIFNRLARGRFPTLGLPALHPFGNAFANVFTVHIDTHPTRPLEGLEALNHGRELHSVVRRQGLATEQFFCRRSRLQQNAPASRARVAFASTVGVNDDVIQGGVSQCKGCRSSGCRPTDGRWTTTCARETLRGFHAGPNMRMPRTFLTATTK